MTLISSLTIGIPAFFLALAPNAQRARPGFLNRVLRFAIPAGVIAAVATFSGYYLATRSLEGTLPTDQALMESRTTATLVLFCVAIWVLSILARPWNWWRITLVASMVAAFVGVLAIPPLRRYFALELPDAELVLAAFGIAAIACLVLELGWRIFGWVDRPIETDPDDAAAFAS